MEVVGPGVLDNGMRACGWCGAGMVAVGRDVCGIGTQVGNGVVVMGGYVWLEGRAAVPRLRQSDTYTVASGRQEGQLPCLFAVESRWQHEW